MHGLGMQTCGLVNQHPAFGIFQGIPETRVELFFERSLNMCMALGVEHRLELCVCRDRVLHLETAAGGIESRHLLLPQSHKETELDVA